VLDWRPELDDLDRIIASALAWERRVAAPLEDIKRPRNGTAATARVAGQSVCDAGLEYVPFIRTHRTRPSPLLSRALQSVRTSAFDRTKS